MSAGTWVGASLGIMAFLVWLYSLWRTRSDDHKHFIVFIIGGIFLGFPGLGAAAYCIAILCGSKP